MSPDPSGGYYADITNPQSLNLYSYVLNNPLKYIDPTGLYCFYGGSGDTVENDSDSSDYDFSSDGPGECGNSGGQWIDNPSSTVTVSADGNSGNILSTFPSDVSQNYQFIPGKRCSTALAAAKKNGSSISSYYNNYQAPINAAAYTVGVDQAFLAAVAVRESGLPANPQVIEAGGGKGRGIFQLDLGKNPNFTTEQAFDPGTSAVIAANMLTTNMSALAAAHPNLSAAELLQATAASYNSGIGNITGNPKTIDKHTTWNNYGGNVVSIATDCF